MTITLIALDLTPQTPPGQALLLQTWGPSILGPGTPPDMTYEDPIPLLVTCNIRWTPLDTCSHLFIGPHCTAPQYWHLVAEVHTVSKRAVRILLECCLVMTNILVPQFSEFRWYIWGKFKWASMTGPALLRNLVTFELLSSVTDVGQNLIEQVLKVNRPLTNLTVSHESVMGCDEQTRNKNVYFYFY